MTALVTRMGFPAMSTTVEITGVGVPAWDVAHAAARGRWLAEEWEARFSRFRPDSLLNRLNAAEGAAVRVDEPFLDLMTTAKAGVLRTSGRFDPSILPALEAAGYDRDIAMVRAASSHAPGDPRPAAGPRGWERVRIDRGRGSVQLPAGMRIDLGGVAKGAFVDHLAAEIASWPGGCVDAGGDLWVWGSAPGGERWAIGIEDPCQPAMDLFVVQPPRAGGIGVATSGTHRRRWGTGAREAHHLIDPGTGTPARDIVRSVTTFAPSVAAAEIAAKALLIAAAEPATAETFGASLAISVHADGHVAISAEVDIDADATIHALHSSSHRSA
jgi:thiamine biosynthesis lipoprotein